VELPGNPQSQWPRILDTFELLFAAHAGHMMWMVDFIRALLTCRGVEQLYPGSSVYSLVVSRWHEGLQDGPPFVGISVDQCGVFTLNLVKEWGSEQVVVRRRVASAVKALRVFVRQLGVHLGPPRREQPPPEAIRRVWLVFPGDRWEEEEQSEQVAAVDRPRESGSARSAFARED
jgi:hypothetical protein